MKKTKKKAKKKTKIVGTHNPNRCPFITNAAEVKSTYGSEFFQGLHDLMNPHVPNVSKTALAKRAKKGNATPK